MLETLETVELTPVRRVIHLTPCCGPGGDLVMVNTYAAPYGSLWITASEALELARKLADVARVTIRAQEELTKRAVK